MSGRRSGKRQWKLNLLAGWLMVLVLYLGVNGIAFRHYYRQNVLVGAAYTAVGGQTVNLLRGLTEPLSIINYVSDAAEPEVALIRGDVAALLEEYEYHGRQGKVTVSVRAVDPYLNFAEARKLAEEYKLTTRENVLIISHKGRHRVLSYSDLADIDTSQLPLGGAARLVAFKAEEAISSAIQALAQGRQTRVYFLSGHGEYNPDTADSDNLGYSVLKSYLERQNSAVARLSLVELPQVPEDADLLVVAGPKSKYHDYEITVLKNYLRTGARGPGGRLVLILDPVTDSGLEDFAADYGVNFRNDIVTAKFATLGQTKVLPDAVVSGYADHPAVAWLRHSGISLQLGRMRSLAVGGETEQAKSAAITPLMRTGEMFWGETDFQNPDAEFDAARDFAGPLNVAVAIDTASVSGGEVQLRGIKMALIGGGQFLTNQLLGPEQVDFFVNLTNWMLEGGKPLGIAPKTPKEFAVTLTPRQTATLALTLLLFPAAGLLAALLVWWKRRS